MVVDSGVIHSLRLSLHTYKKCFSGKEFVDQLLLIGHEAETNRANRSEPVTPSPLASVHGCSPGLGGNAGYGFSSSSIIYSVHYAKEVGQYLVSEGILLPLPDLVAGVPNHDSEGDSEVEVKEGEVGYPRRVPLVGTSHPQQVREGRWRSGAVMESPSNTAFIASRMLHQPPNLLTDSQETDSHITTAFTYSPTSLYKFADVEDFESCTLYHSQVLTSVTHPQAASRLEEGVVSEQARRGMLFLVHDLLQQRARKERRAKQFLQTPHAEAVAEQRREHFINCDLIFKM